MAFYRNTASQKIGAQLASATDGSQYTTGPVSIFVTLDAGTQTAGTGGAGVHEGEGYWTYSPSQAETDGILCAYTFIGSGAVPQTIQIFTTAVPTLTPTTGVPVAGAVAALDLITDSFYELNVFMPGESIPNSDAQFGLRSLNGLIGSWATQSLTIPAVARPIMSWTIGKGGPTNPYTIGAGGDIDVPRPVSQQSLKQAMLLLIDGATEIPLGIMTDQSYDQLPVKSLAGTQPSQVYYNPTFTSGLGALYAWPVPSTTNTQLVLYVEQALTTFGNLTTAYQLPPGYADAITFGLARRFAMPYGRQVSEDLNYKADRALMLIKRSNLKMSDMTNAFARQSRSDINSVTVWVR